MKRAGVIGWPIEHSLSPVLHGYWLNQPEHSDIKGSYERIAIPPDELTRDKLLELRDEGFVGFNVTIPHKETAFSLADKFDDAAPFTGAANVLFFMEDDKIGARNTDVSGIQDSLRKSLGDISLGEKNIVLLGAGGAARAIAYALQGLDVAKISVLNRHKDRAEKLIEHVNKYRPQAKFVAGTFEDWPEVAKDDAWLVINATSAGMRGHPPLDIDLAHLSTEAAICDIVYNPLETPLLKAARMRGHKRIVDGLGMLMYQAKPSFEIFFGKNPEVTPGLRAELEKALATRG
jgi:shikimate dehydrogenase